MQLPVPTTAFGRAVERAILVLIASIISATLLNVALSPVVYFVLKTLLDVINPNIPTA